MSSSYWERYARRRYTRRRVLGTAGIAGAGGVSAMLVGCGDDDDDPTPTTSGGAQPTQDTAGQPKVGGQYRWAWQGTPHLDIHQDSIAGASAIISAAYNRLLRFADDEQVPEPDLAAAMPEQPDPQTFVFDIEQGVKFHNKPPLNGRVMTAHDVAFSLNRARTDDPLFIHRGDIESIDVIEAVDDKTLRITTKVPNAVILTTLASYQFIVLGEETVEQYGDLKTDTATIGTGPFVVETASTDQGATLVRHPDYWRTGKPYFERVQQFVIADHWSQMLAGNLEVAAVAAELQTGFDSFEEVLEDAGIEAYTYNGPSSGSGQAHFMNSGAAPFNDVRVREAINLILNRDDNLSYGYPIGGLRMIALDYGKATAGFGLPEEEILGMRGFREGHEQDVKDGLAMLEQVGYTKDNPLKFEIMAWSVPQRVIGIDNLQVASEMYARESGGVIETTVKGLEWGTWKQAEARHEFQMISSSYAMGFDAHDALVKMYHSQGGRNFAQYKDPEFDRMLLEEQAEFDIEARKVLVQEMLRYLNDPSRIANAWVGTGPAAAASIAAIKGRPALFDSGKIDQLYYG